MTRGKKPFLEIPVSYGSVTLYPRQARIGISILASDLSIAQAHEHLCGRRLTATLLARPEGASATQQGFPGMGGDTTLQGEFDVRSLGLTNGTITATLAFRLQPGTLEDLGRFAKREGMLTIERVGDFTDGANAKAE
jgi:hypothetical protein